MLVSLSLAVLFKYKSTVKTFQWQYLWSFRRTKKKGNSKRISYRWTRDDKLNEIVVIQNQSAGVRFIFLLIQAKKNKRQRNPNIHSICVFFNNTIFVWYSNQSKKSSEIYKLICVRPAHIIIHFHTQTHELILIRYLGLRILCFCIRNTNISFSVNWFLCCCCCWCAKIFDLSENEQ